MVDAHDPAQIAIAIGTTTATARERNGFVIGWWEICGLDVITRPFAGDDGMTIRRRWLTADAIAVTMVLWAGSAPHAWSATQAARSVNDGVDTAAQVQRAGQVFEAMKAE